MDIYLPALGTEACSLEPESRVHLGSCASSSKRPIPEGQGALQLSIMLLAAPQQLPMNGTRQHPSSVQAAS